MKSIVLLDLWEQVLATKLYIYIYISQTEMLMNYAFFSLASKSNKVWSQNAIIHTHFSGFLLLM